jgi:phosphatidylglycerophosphate synthase
MITHQNDKYLLIDVDGWIRDYFVKRLPKWATTELLTLSTLACCATVIIIGLLAETSYKLILLISIIVLIQHITDVLDGAVGRYRKSGLVNWGYYMDHLMDYVFVTSIIFSYFLFLPSKVNYLLIGVYAVLSISMVHSFLLTAIKGNFTFHYNGIGTTEIKALFITVNLAAAFLGIKFLEVSLTLALLGLTVMSVRVIYVTQSELKALDISIKSSRRP